MNTFHDPTTLAPPLGAYSHAVEVPAGARTLHISGQVGMLRDERIPSGITAQAEAAWSNVLAILEAAGMGVGDLVKVTTFLVDADDLEAVRAVRRRHLGDHRPAATLVVVTRLASPDFLIEIEATAATTG